MEAGPLMIQSRTGECDMLSLGGSAELCHNDWGKIILWDNSPEV